MESCLNIISTSILLGAVYGLAAVGMGLIFGVMGVLNLAHGAFVLLGGFLSWAGVKQFGLPISATIPATVSITVVIGIFLWKWGLSEVFTLSGSGEEKEQFSTQILVTLGFTMLVEDLVTRWSPQGVFSLPLDYPVIKTSYLSFSSIRLLILFIVLTIFFALSRVLLKTDFGLMVRALIQDRKGAVILSVPYRTISMVVFCTGCAMAGLAGVFYLIIYPITPQMSLSLSFKALLIVIMGGTGRLMNTLFSAFLLGFAEVWGGSFADAEIQSMIPYIGLVIILIISPRGIGWVMREKP